MPRGLTAEYSMTATSYKRAWHSRPPPSESASRPSSRARIRCPLRRTTPRALSVDTLPVASGALEEPEQRVRDCDCRCYEQAIERALVADVPGPEAHRSPSNTTHSYQKYGKMNLFSTGQTGFAKKR